MSRLYPQINSSDPQYYQTRNIDATTWQDIFYRASHIPLLEEFTTHPRAYNILPCALGGHSEASHTIPWELTNALRTRLNIVLVCKAWRDMGLEVLCSHIRVFESFLREVKFYTLLTANPQLLLYTKRLTIDPGGWRRLLFGEPAWEPSYRASWLCSSLPQLQILEAHGSYFLYFHSSTFRRGWKWSFFENRGLWEWICPKLQNLSHCAGKPSSAVLFTSLEDLQVSETPDEGNQENLAVIQYIAANWTAPRLSTLSIGDITWLSWAPFLRRHAGSLRILDFPTHDPLEKYETWKSTKNRSTLIQFPKLRELYLPYGKNIPYVMAGQLQRVGVHNIGSSGPDYSDRNANRPEHLNRLLEIFRFWQRYPTATTYCIHGWHGDTLWLQEQPEVAQYIQRIDQIGVRVEWMHLGQDDNQIMNID